MISVVLDGEAVKSRAVALEAKCTAGERIAWERVTEEQRAFLEARQGLGAWCFVAVGFGGGGVYRVPWVVWRDMKGMFGRKYVTEGDLGEFRVPGRGLVPLVLEGLV